MEQSKERVLKQIKVDLWLWWAKLLTLDVFSMHQIAHGACQKKKKKIAHGGRKIKYYWLQLLLLNYTSWNGVESKLFFKEV